MSPVLDKDDAKALATAAAYAAVVAAREASLNVDAIVEEALKHLESSNRFLVHAHLGMNKGSIIAKFEKLKSGANKAYQEAKAIDLNATAFTRKNAIAAAAKAAAVANYARASETAAEATPGLCRISEAEKLWLWHEKTVIDE
jgi:hypothetical protein